MLEVRGLVKRYGEVVALDGLSLTVPPGGMYGFVGRNGSGKTTTMRIVLGVLAADAGDVLWQGRPITTDDRRRVGYMPEERGLYPKMRVRDQLEYLAKIHGAQPAEASAAVGDWLERVGLADRGGDRIEALSLGNQQRVQLLAALVHRPDLLVLDEPFSGLDPVAVDAMADLLQARAREGVPVIFSSHQLELVERLCDTVGIVRDGRMVASGTVEELRGLDRERRVVVDVVDASGEPVGDSWWLEVPGVTDKGLQERGRVLVLGADADDQALLAAAVRAGRVRSFGEVRPTLTELFREVAAA